MDMVELSREYSWIIYGWIISRIRLNCLKNMVELSQDMVKLSQEYSWIISRIWLNYLNEECYEIYVGFSCFSLDN
jgi:hypothetical protein